MVSSAEKTSCIWTNLYKWQFHTQYYVSFTRVMQIGHYKAKYEKLRQNHENKNSQT